MLEKAYAAKEMVRPHVAFDILLVSDNMLHTVGTPAPCASSAMLGVIGPSGTV